MNRRKFGALPLAAFAPKLKNESSRRNQFLLR